MKSPRGASGTGGQEVDQANGVVHDDDTNAAPNPPKRQCQGVEPVAQPEQEEDSDVDGENQDDEEGLESELEEEQEDFPISRKPMKVESSGSSSEPDSSDDESRPNNKGKVTAEMSAEEWNERLRHSKWGKIMEERRARADKEIELEQEEMAKEYEEQRKEWEERDRKDEEERQRKAKLPKMVVNGVTLRYIEEDMRQLYEEEIAPRPKPPQWQNGKLLEPEPDPEPISWEAFLERQAEWHVKYPQPSRTPSREGSVVDSDATSGRSSPSGGVQENNTEESGEEGDDEEMEAQHRNKSDSEQEEDQEENN